MPVCLHSQLEMTHPELSWKMVCLMVPETVSAADGSVTIISLVTVAFAASQQSLYKSRQLRFNMSLVVAENPPGPDQTYVYDGVPPIGVITTEPVDWPARLNTCCNDISCRNIEWGIHSPNSNTDGPDFNLQHLWRYNYKYRQEDYWHP